MKKALEISLLWMELAPRMIRATKSEIQSVADGKLTHPQFRILAGIQRGLDTVSKIAQDHGVSQPAMSKMVESLVRKGLVERLPNSQDRRQIQLKLSKKGQSLFVGLKNKAAHQLSLKIQKLNPSDQQKLSKALIDLESCWQQIKPTVGERK